LKKQFSDQVQM